MLQLKDIKGIGKVLEGKLNQLGINSVFDLLKFFPSKYLDLGNPKSLKEVDEDDYSVVKGKLLKCSGVSNYGRKQFSAEFSDLYDSSYKFKVLYFNMPYMKDNFENDENGEFVFLGKFSKKGQRFFETTNPVAESNKKSNSRLHGIYTIYPLKGIVGPNIFKNILNNAFKQIDEENHLLNANKFTDFSIELTKLFKEIHFSESIENVEKAYNKLSVIDTALALEIHKKVSIGYDNTRKVFYNNVNNGIVFYKNGEINNTLTQKRLIDEYQDLIGFKLSPTQVRTILDIEKDLFSDKNMSRIVCGDVGSGKTAVAFYALIIAALFGKQAVLVAPTEILAKQHALKFEKIANFYNINYGFLSSSTTPKNKKLIYEKLENNEISVCFGTQSLISESIKYDNLCLAIVDEQHKFGVSQRSKLEQKGAKDILSLTATPIPRSLALTFLSDIDVSYISKRGDASKVSTHIVQNDNLEDVIIKIINQANNGIQSFIVCPAIYNSDGFNIQSIEGFINSYGHLFNKNITGVLHGKVNNDMKNQIMNDFKNGVLKILIATSVIEVGIDTEASNILIVNADRFGIASLHQLRGRVGRRGQKAVCYLHQNTYSDASYDRLHALETLDDGLMLAEKDFEMRGSGSILGLKQSGVTRTMIFNLPFSLNTLKNAEGYSINKLSQFNVNELIALTRLNKSQISEYYNELHQTTLNS